MEHSLKQHSLPCSLLKLEITEGIVIQNLDDTISKMRRLEKLGVSFAMDDFGTGYSSLTYLKRLPVDALKIDQSFVRDATHDPNDAEIIRAIVAMARSLNLEVIAEGVETLEQLAFLQSWGAICSKGIYTADHCLSRASGGYWSSAQIRATACPRVGELPRRPQSSSRPLITATECPARLHMPNCPAASSRTETLFMMLAQPQPQEPLARPGLVFAVVQTTNRRLITAAGRTVVILHLGTLGAGGKQKPRILEHFLI